MSSTIVVRNRDVETVLIGVPKDHKHIRICIKLRNKSTMVFQEATIANILRAYTTVKTHPIIRAQILNICKTGESSRKQEYAIHQLLETNTDPERIAQELKEILEQSTVDV